MHDKSYWQSVKADRFSVPEGLAPADAIPELLGYLGSTDPALRDELGYEVLGTWIARGVFSERDLNQLTNQCLKGLEHCVGETETDTVFLRSFSVLILAELVRRDAKAPFLAKDGVLSILESTVRYLGAEQDLRGFVPGKGWAHAAAHTGDLLRMLASHPALGAVELQRILSTIGAKVTAPTPYPFVEREEYRLAVAVRAVLDRGLLNAEWLTAWICSLATDTRWEEDLRARHHNAFSFVSGLTLMLSMQEPPDAVLLAEARRALKAFAPWF